MVPRPTLRRVLACAVSGLALTGALAIPTAASAETPLCSKVAVAGASVQQLVDSLLPGETGCLRAGGYSQSVTITRGGVAGRPVTLRSYPGDKATLTGRLVVKKGADFVVVEDLWLDGRNAGNLPSPTVNGNDVIFRNNDVTNQHTAICFVLGASNVDSSATYGRALRPVVERNRIHNCGKLPAANHDHGIYVEGTDDAQIRGNWIYDNADRGIQLYPDAQRTSVTGNVLDGNGTNLIFSGDLGIASSNTIVRGNLITRAKLRFNVESWYPAGNPKGTNNLLTANCLYGAARTDFGLAGINTGDGGFTASGNTTLAPGYVNATAHDYRLTAGSPCLSLYLGDPSALPGPRLTAVTPTPTPTPTPTEPAPTPTEPAPTPTEPVPTPTEPKPRGPKHPKPRSVSLATVVRSAPAVVTRHGRALGLVGRVHTATRSKQVLIQMARRGGWRTVAVGRVTRTGRFSVRWMVRAPRHASALRLRARAPGVGSSRTLVVGLARR